MKPPRRFWTVREINAMRRVYANPDGFSLNVIAKILDRTPAAVACKAEALGLTSRRGRFVRRAETKVLCSIRQTEVASRDGESERRSEATKRWQARIGHPRGFLGGKHSASARAAISKAHLGSRMPRDVVLRSVKTRLARYGTVAPKGGRGTWISGWETIGGCRFFARSRWEARYARHLESLKDSGEISAWAYEAETFLFEGYEDGPCSYLPDFKATLASGHIEFHEVKGWKDERFRLQMTRMAERYPSTVVIVRDGAWFRANPVALEGCK